MDLMFFLIGVYQILNDHLLFGAFLILVAFLLRKRKPSFLKSSITLPTYRGMKYHTIRDRAALNHVINDRDHTLKPGHVYLGYPDDFDRIIGACVTYDGALLTKHKRLIKNGVYKRDDETRRKANVPAFDNVKHEWATLNGKNVPLYHRTHLIPFRFCLNDGGYEQIMFTGTARLNSGERVDIQYKPTDADHAANVQRIKRPLPYNKFYFMDPENTVDLSLDDFERLADACVYDDHITYKHVYKYGVECFYDRCGDIPDRVEVTLIDTTAKQLLWKATLLNQK